MEYVLVRRLAFAAFTFICGVASAQQTSAYPSKPVRMIVPNGQTDEMLTGHLSDGVAKGGMLVTIYELIQVFSR